MVNDGKSAKRKKFHDKDKYYKLAKEQGLRSRAAFKLSQINRQYPILQKARVVLDLCAAPGGWTQIAARNCGPQTQIVAVDILPIRSLGNRNITTIVGDITTEKCKAEIKRAIPTSNNKNDDKGNVDVVLHDGAPNVGGAYEKDAYEQIELSVHALRCATQHLRKGGTFITKIYRSRDSASFQWVVQQLFEEVTSFKPKASRQQSAEIFYVCQNYYKPDKIDPRLLDPKHIFEFVEGDTTGASTPQASANYHVFHKSWDSAKRHRDGYDTEHLDATLRHVEPLNNFVQTKGRLDAIRLLSQCTAFSFACEECKDNNKSTKKKDAPSSCHCQFYLHHPLTTPEIKECVIDLKVLNKGDFKGIMIWRERMILTLEEQRKDVEKKEDVDDDSSDEEEHAAPGGAANDEEEEDQIQREIKELRERKVREKKRIKKKERKVLAKKRKQAAYGMDLNAIDVQEHDQFFSLSTLQSAKDLSRISEVNLDQVTDEQVFGADSEDEEEIRPTDENDEEDEKAKLYRLEQDLDGAYDKYLATTKDGMAKSGTKAAKRSKRLMREKVAQESHEDHEILLAGKEEMDKATKVYAGLLQGPKDSDDDDDDDDDNDDDGFDAEPMTPEESQARKKKQKTTTEATGNPLIHQFPDDPTAVKTARWFNNPLFASIGQAAESATTVTKAVNKTKEKSMEEPPSSDDEDSDADAGDQSNNNDDSDDESSSKEEGSKKKKRNQKNKKTKGLDADDVFALMPKTDKQTRHEKRLKALARDERRQARKVKRLGETEGDFDLAPANNTVDDHEDDIEQMAGMSEGKKQKLLEARKLIKAGMGKTSGEDDTKQSNKPFEVVEQDRPLPVIDHRKYDSENEEYDSDDHAKTMALGTMMLRRSKAKALVDASYNRFAWNDPGELPEWFVDDENKHYRPQLPIPAALLAKMKDKMIALSTKPIAKVAEARARKNRKIKSKLADAKKKAVTVANSADMSEAMKLKSISKALRSSDSKSGKEYVVAKKGRGMSSGKGVQVVDKRMKSDKRSMERATKKRKGGKKGAMTGSKRRRQHN